MLSLSDNGKCIFICVWSLVASVATAEESDTINWLQHPVIKKYISPEEIAVQIADVEHDKPKAIEAIRKDFDLAIRSALALEAPGESKGPRPHRLPDVPFLGVHKRSSLKAIIEELSTDPTKVAGSEFLREHFDDLVLEDWPYLLLVMRDVASHGWTDWSSWDAQNARLLNARKKWPNIHRDIALDKLMYDFRDTAATGLLLRIALNEGDPLGRKAMYALRDLGDYEDLLNVYIEAALDSSASDERRWRFWREIMAVTEQRGKAPAYWEPYLDSDVPTLWYCAQVAFDRPLPQNRVKWILENQGQWNYDHEPDPEVRQELGRKREYARRLAEIKARENPETGRLSPEDIAELQALQAEFKEIEKETNPVSAE